MPHPFKRLTKEVGLWGASDIPTLIQYRVLCHLASDPESRLYIQDEDRAAVSNASGVPGWSIRGGLFLVLSGCHANNHAPWVSLDKTITKRSPRGMRVYKINPFGFEAIAQYGAYKRFREESLKLARKLLIEEREKAQTLRPT